jgi:SAM-dependent methyltransferase
MSLLEKYEDLCREFGREMLRQSSSFPRRELSDRLVWGDRSSHIASLKAIVNGMPIEGKSILDVGCGLGHLWDYVQEKKPKSYLGIDCIPEFIEGAKKRNSDHSEMFSCQRFSDFEPNRQYDIVVANLVFQVYHSDWDDLVKESINKMYSLCNDSVWVTFYADLLMLTGRSSPSVTRERVLRLVNESEVRGTPKIINWEILGFGFSVLISKEI